MIRTSTGIRLVRLGAGFVGFALLASMWASPNRAAGLAWFIIAMTGVALVVIVTGRYAGALARRVQPRQITAVFFGISTIALLVTLFASRWPSYKLSWLNALYSALPSVRSLPVSWMQEGLQPNQTGGFLAVCTAMMTAMALNPWTEARGETTSVVRQGSSSKPGPAWRWLAVFLATAGFVVVFMTGSRAALAGLVTAILLVVILRTRRLLWLWGTGLGVSALGLYASGRLDTILNFFLHDETLDTKLVARLDIWSSALKGAEDHLLTGIGLGVFNDVMPVRYPYQTVGLSYPVSQAHNLLLDVALSMGIMGAIGLGMLLLGSALLAIDGSRTRSASGLVSLGILASIVTFLIFGITDSISFTIPTSFIVWLWASALVVLGLKRQNESGDGR